MNSSALSNDETRNLCEEMIFSVIGEDYVPKRKFSNIANLCDEVMIKEIKRDYLSKTSQYALKHIIPKFPESKAYKEIYENH